MIYFNLRLNPDNTISIAFHLIGNLDRMLYLTLFPQSRNCRYFTVSEEEYLKYWSKVVTNPHVYNSLKMNYENRLET